MEKKPVPILILALAQVLTPVASVVLTSLLFHIPMSAIWQDIVHTSPWYRNLDFFLAGPICAFAIYRVRPWSYPVFLACSIWVAINNILTWSRQPEAISIWGLLFFLSLNMILVGYFLLPTVRKMYFDYSIRWWDTPPRFQIQIPVTLYTSKGKDKAMIYNLSRGGALLQTAFELPSKSEIQVQFQAEGRTFELSGTIVWSEREVKNLSGMRFQLTSLQAYELKGYLDGLDKRGIERRPRKTRFVQDTIDWFDNLFKTGKGLVPTPSEPSSEPKKPDPKKAA